MSPLRPKPCRYMSPLRNSWYLWKDQQTTGLGTDVSIMPSNVCRFFHSQGGRSQNCHTWSKWSEQSAHEFFILPLICLFKNVTHVPFTHLPRAWNILVICSRGFERAGTWKLARGVFVKNATLRRFHDLPKAECKPHRMLTLCEHEGIWISVRDLSFKM